MNFKVVYCKELNKYYESIKVASVCTSFTEKYIKRCINGMYKRPWYYHFSLVPWTDDIILTTYNQVRTMCDINKEIKKINERFSPVGGKKWESKIDIHPERNDPKPAKKKKEPKKIFINKLNKWLTVDEVKAYCKANLEELKKNKENNI